MIKPQLRRCFASIPACLISPSHTANPILHGFAEPGLNYLCRGFKTFFAHALPEVERIVATLSQQLLRAKPRL